MMMTRFVWLMSLWLAFISLSSRAEVRLEVSDQASFDRLSKDLAEALKSNELEVVVDFRKGVYRYRENHLTLKGLYLPGKRVVLRCNESVFLAEGPDYQLKTTNFRTYSAPEIDTLHLDEIHKAHPIVKRSLPRGGISPEVGRF